MIRLRGKYRAITSMDISLEPLLTGRDLGKTWIKLRVSTVTCAIISLELLLTGRDLGNPLAAGRNSSLVYMVG